jgi:hypothetical protein
VQTSAECKTDRSAVLTAMSGLDPRMINKLKDENKSWFDELWVVLLSSFLKWVGINLHLVNRRSLIKSLTNIKTLQNHILSLIALHLPPLVEYQP